MEHIRASLTTKVTVSIQETSAIAELRLISAPASLIHRRIKFVLGLCKVIAGAHQIVLLHWKFSMAHLSTMHASSVRVHVDLRDLVVTSAHQGLDVSSLRSVPTLDV